MHSPALAISLLGSELKALGFRRGATAGQWDTSLAWEEPDDLMAPLREAQFKTQAEGRDIALVMAHARFTDQVVEIPPAKGWTLERLLERQAQTSKTFPGTAAWSWQPALPTKKNNAALIHLFPKATLDQLAFACQKAHLRLVRVLPTSAVLIGHLKQLPLEKDELALLVAATGSSTTIVIGRKDGRVALGRVLASNWLNAPDRVWVDLTRSIGFAEQQCGAPVNSVWLFGAGAEQQVAPVQAVVKIPVRISPVPYTPFYWAEQAARLPDRNDGNLVSLDLRQAPQRRRMLTATMAILMLLVVLAGGAASAVELVRRLELSSAREIDRVMTRLEQRKTEWQKRYADAERKRQVVRLITDEGLPPVPIWFLGYLGEVVPDELVLTEARVLRTNQSWSLRLAGLLETEGGATTDGATLLAQSLSALTNRLATGPFQVTITNTIGSARTGPMESTVAPSVSLPGANAAELASGKSGPNQFLVEGIIR